MSKSSKSKIDYSGRAVTRAAREASITSDDVMLALRSTSADRRYTIERAACGKQSHWTVLFEGEQVACRSTKSAARTYISEALAR